MPPDINVIIDGIDQAAVIAEIESTIRAVIREARVDGKWTVRVAASDTRGRWDLGIRGPARRHFLSFAAVLDRVPALVGDHLRKALARL